MRKECPGKAFLRSLPILTLGSFGLYQRVRTVGSGARLGRQLTGKVLLLWLGIPTNVYTFNTVCGISLTFLGIEE